MLFVSIALGALPDGVVFAQCPDGSAPPCGTSSRTPPPQSVAVLYFDNLSRDTAYAYLADALTEELIAKLADIPRLVVRSRFSVRRYRASKTADPASVGQTLAAAFLVTGSVRPGSERVRVTVELVQASNGSRVWGRVIDRPITDLLGVTQEIAGEVTAGIVGRLLPAERTALSLRPTRNQQAYDHLARGNYFLAQRSARSGTRAIQEYQTAIRLDPGFAGAYARLALAYGLARVNHWDIGLSSDSLNTTLRQAVERARALDSLNADVVLATSLEGNSLSEGTLAAAVARDPENAELHHVRGMRLAILGDFVGAQEALHRSVAIDPDRPLTLGWLSFTAVAERRYGDAKRWIDSALALNPAFPGYAHRAIIDLQLGDTAGARRDATAASQASGGSGVGAASVALVQAATGDAASARLLIQRLFATGGAGPGPNDEARAYAIAALGLLGDTAAALDILERAPSTYYVRLLSVLSVFDPLRDQPRFQRMMRDSVPEPR
jgi:TolB-like protein/Flp pilus assembly protein TadD